MGMVASTCFQHNPATQPQAFTVLAALATEEVDDDIIYQVLIAMSSILKTYSDRHSFLITSMARCLARLLLPLTPDSRYPSDLFWVGIGLLQMGHLPLVATGLDLVTAALTWLATNGAFLSGLDRALLEDRSGNEKLTGEIDHISGVNFEGNLHFSLVSIIWKGVRHPASKQKTIDCLLLLCRLSSAEGHPYFVSLLPVVAGSPEDLAALFDAVEMPVPKDLGTAAIFDMLEIR